MNQRKITIHSSFLIGISFAILLFPFRWLFAWIFAAAVHEASHLMALRIIRSPIRLIELKLSGAQIHTDELIGPKATFSFLSGPAGGFVLLLFSRQMPRVAICAFFQSIYNLLPLFSLDGGRAIWGALGYYLSYNQALMIMKCLNYAIVLVIFVFSIRFHSALLVVVALILVVRIYKNIPCKQNG